MKKPMDSRISGIIEVYKRDDPAVFAAPRIAAMEDSPMRRNDTPTIEWKAIPNFPGYEVSTIGDIRSTKYKKPRILKPRYCKGYRVACLRSEGKTHYVRLARIVLEAFVGPCPDGHEAAHLNGKREDNGVSNLAWVTHKENIAHKRLHGTQTSGPNHSQAKLTFSDIAAIKKWHSDGVSTPEIALRLGVHRATVRTWIRRVSLDTKSEAA